MFTDYTLSTYRHLNTESTSHQTNQLPSRMVRIDGTEYLFFSGTSYLGMAQNADFQALIVEGLRQYGSVYGSSRNGNLQLEIYAQAEQKLANWTGAEAALTLSSGMLAGQAVVRQLWLEGATFVYSPDAHPAVWHSPQVDIPNVTFDEWAAGLSKKQFKETDKITLVTNSTDALRGNLYDFDWVNNLSEVPLTLVIDDSHGLGIRGAAGAGVFSQIPRRRHLRVIVTASLAKATGLAGGVILAEKSLLQTIRNSAYFSGCSPIAPNHLHAYLHADHLYAQAQQKLAENIALFANSTQDLELFSSEQSYPVFYTNRDDLYPFLFQRKVLIYSFSYPQPTDKANTRIVLSAWHTTADVELLAALCRKFVGR